MIDLSSLMPPTALLRSKQHYFSFALKVLDFLFASQLQFLAVYSLVYTYTHRLLFMLKEGTEMKMLKYFMFTVS